ncbi:histidine ammonia-lyase [Komagataeibacter xylinus]|nr:phenylalanine and histidine ammonia-lyase family protein 2 [Komagataeibacter xylinus E25]RFP06529.1 histidine ammonia-lyase [Komagataeibacter xylinus]
MAGFLKSATRAAVLATSAFALQLELAMPAQAWEPIRPVTGVASVVLTGHDMTLADLMHIARDGAKVSLSTDAAQRSHDAFDLLLEAAREGMAVYWFNRGAGDKRESWIFKGDPLEANNHKLLEQIQLQRFQMEAPVAGEPEVQDESLVRAVMAIRANTMTYEAASPALTQMLQDLLNHRITPVLPLRGSLGEGDLRILCGIAATMIGVGDAYYNGVRMSAADALHKAGLTPLKPFGADDAALISSDAYAVARAAFAVEEGRRALDWADLTLAIDLQGMNSSVTPLSAPVQAGHPYLWLNWDAKRVMQLLKGSYLFDADPHRVIQDPESLRASSIRQGAAWQSWSELQHTVQIELNSSDHNPAIRVGVSPDDSWELSTPQMMQYYVRGSDADRHLHGYILSNANWDPYPLANQVEAFTIALGNMDVAITQRIYRFENPFFTIVSPRNILNDAQYKEYFSSHLGYAAADVFQDVQGQLNPVPPEGNAIIATVEDLQAQTYLKTVRLQQTVTDTMQLLAMDMNQGCSWMALRGIQDSSRTFGPMSHKACSLLPRGPSARMTFLTTYDPAALMPDILPIAEQTH